MCNSLNLSRRKFLAGLSTGVLLNTLPAFMRDAHAADDYKALVCVFLAGGNDGNNMIVPTDSAGYARYAGVRGDYTAGNGAIGLPQSTLLSLAPAKGNAQFGAHPEFTELQQVWNSGDLAVLFNTGTLLQPMTKTDYANASLRPDRLFSHIDQQGQAQSSIAQGGSTSGWGGRIADTLKSTNSGAKVPSLISISSGDLFTIGQSTSGLTVPPTGTFGFGNFTGSYTASVNNALSQILQNDRNNALVVSAQDTVSAAVASSAALAPVLAGTSSSINDSFNGQTSGIAQQLLQVAHIIEARASLGVKRQIFYVTLGGFDTHNGQIATQTGLYGQLSPALKSFQDAMAQLGVADQVTAFTMSDFARTFKPASGGGSDHAWGNHHLIMGGAVRGQNFYGTFPQQVLGGSDDVDGAGRWLPTTSIDQYGATLARWFGVSDTDLATVFPNLKNFSSSNLGFLG